MHKTLSKWESYYDKAVKVEAKTHQLLECGQWSFNWMANQTDSSESDESIGIGFVLGGEFAFISYDDMSKDVDELAHDCAKQILGYRVGSKQDIERKQKWYHERITEKRQKQQALESEIAGLAQCIHELNDHAAESED